MQLAFWRPLKRGELNLFFLAALVAFLALPGASAHALPPGSCEAVFCWLQAETGAAVPARVQSAASLLALTAPQTNEAPTSIPAAPLLSVATGHSGQFALPLAPKAPTTLAVRSRLLSFHEAGQLSGVRTNSNLE